MSASDLFTNVKSALGLGLVAPTCPEVQVVGRAPVKRKVTRVDLSGVPHALKSNEWNATVKRDPSELVGGVLHQWASKVDTMAIDRVRFGEAEALARRGLAVPYTLVAGVTRHSREPVAALVHPLERYTYASDAACANYVAIGVMALMPFEEETRSSRHTPVTAELAAAIEECLAWLAELLDPHRAKDAAPLSLITHRQGINGPRDHVECPGEAVVAMACASEWVQHGAYVPMPDLVLKPPYGKPWPPSWRRHLPNVLQRDDAVS